MSNQRTLFEAAVVSRLAESGFLEIEVRTEGLARCDDGYQDEVINAGWHYWNAALVAQSTTVSNAIGWVTVRVEDTGDGLIINADDAKEWRLVADQRYEGHFLPDGKYRIAIPQRAPKDSPGPNLWA